MQLLNVLVYEVVLRNILWIYGTGHNQLSSKCSSQDHLHQVNKILLGFEAANKLGVVWCADKKETQIRTYRIPTNVARVRILDPASYM